MDDMQATEHRIAREMLRRAGPSLPVDDVAVIDAVVAATRSQGWRFTRFSAFKLIGAAAIVALFGGFLLAGVPLAQPEQPAPGAELASAEPTYVPPVPVIGTMNADADGIDWGPADDVTQRDDRVSHRGGGNTWTFEVSDPRLSGVAYELRNMDMVGPEYQYHEGEIHVGTIELVNADGSWMGSLRGYATMGPAIRHWHIELAGTGDYEGLSALLEAVAPYGSAELEGLVFPGALPAYPDPVEVPAE